MTNYARLLLFLVTCSCSTTLFAVDIDTVFVGETGNPTSVPYDFRIGTYEVTNSQYVEFLNSVAASDPYELYHKLMTTDTRGGILRTEMAGSFSYSVKPPAIGQGVGGEDYTYENKPVVFVSWYDAVRFTNWLHNGQGNGDTESGAYNLYGPSVPVSNISVNGETLVPSNYLTVTRNENARWFLPNGNEWYKAACFDPTTKTYYDYPTGTNVVPNNNSPSHDTGNSANFGVDALHAAFPLADVGSYSNSSSPYGTFDQLGNVTEWIERLTASNFNVSGGLWGNAWNGSVEGPYGPSTCCWFADDYAWFKLSHVGFRVATMVPEPSGLMLSIVALTVILRIRKSKV